MLRKLFLNSKKTAVILTALLALLAGSIFFLKEMNKRSKAAPGVPTLSYSITPDPLQSGQNFDLILKVNPNGASFFAFELYSEFDPAKVEFQNASNLSQNITTSHILVNSSVDTTNSVVAIVGTKTGTALTGNSDLELARIKMKVIAGASGDVGFSWAMNTKLGSNINKEMLDGTFTIGGGSVEPTSPPGQGGPDLHIDIPSLGAVGGSLVAERNESVDVQVFLKTNNNEVKALDFILPYDDSFLTFQNTTDLSSNIEIEPDSGFNTQFAIKIVDEAEKKIKIALVVPVQNQVPVPVSSPDDILIAVIRFKVKADAPLGQVSLLPDTSSTIYNLQTQNIITCTGGIRFTISEFFVTDIPTTPGFPTSTPIFDFPTATPVIGLPSNTPFITSTQPTNPPTTPPPPSYVQMSLDLRFKFQGILSMPNRANPQPVKITVSSESKSVSESLNTNFNVDPNGIWSQSILAILPPAPDYKIFIKGPMHLQKRICDVSPSEADPGSYGCQDGSIQLDAGSNYLDFSGIHLLAGDLPQQDGISNSYDVSLVINHIGKTNPVALTQADLNLDGIVDSQDYSLVIAALAFRSDDEF